MIDELSELLERLDLMTIYQAGLLVLAVILILYTVVLGRQLALLTNFLQTRAGRIFKFAAWLNIILSLGILVLLLML